MKSKKEAAGLAAAPKPRPAGEPRPREALPAPMPDRPELSDLPRAPRLIMEIARLQRYRLKSEEVSGVLSQHTARLLMAYLSVGDGISQLSLAEETRLTPPTVSVLLRRMEAEGYVERRTDSADRRVTRVYLTEKGKAFDRDHLRRISMLDREAMVGFSEKEEETLLSLLTRIRDNIDNTARS